MVSGREFAAGVAREGWAMVAEGSEAVVLGARALGPNVGRQLARLVQVGESDVPEIGYLVRLLMLCTLPRRNPGRRLQYRRTNGPYELVMTATGTRGLPFGSLARVILAWVCTEALRTKSRELVLGHSLAEFMRKVGLSGRSGGRNGLHTRVRDQLERLFHTTVRLVQYEGAAELSVSSQFTSSTELWWDVRAPEEAVLFESKVVLGEELFREILGQPVPLDLGVLKAMMRSSVGLDLYLWLAYRTFTLEQPVVLSWRQLYFQFGARPEQGVHKAIRQNFRASVLRELRKLEVAWPDLRYEVRRGGLKIWPSRSIVRPRLEM